MRGRSTCQLCTRTQGRHRATLENLIHESKVTWVRQEAPREEGKKRNPDEEELVRLAESVNQGA